jgi:hypothetical protein
MHRQGYIDGCRQGFLKRAFLGPGVARIAGNVASRTGAEISKFIASPQKGKTLMGGALTAMTIPSLLPGKKMPVKLQTNQQLYGKIRGAF